MSNLVLDQVTVEKTKKKGLRLNSAQIFLTYAQCPVELDSLLKHIEKIVDEWGLKNYIIAQENHKDGNKHIHAYLLLNRKPNKENAERMFDYLEYHPKVETCRSYKNVIKYVTKEGNYISNYDPEILKNIIKENMKVGELYEKARDLAKNFKVKEGLAVLEHSKTIRDLTIHGNAIQKNLRSLAVKRHTPDYSLDDFRIDFEWDKSRSLILWGPTNLGKTNLAHALLPRALIMSHIDKLKSFDELEYEGIIFDDMSFKHWPREAQIHIVDYDFEREINVKHSHVIIPRNTPKIFTTNLMPAEIMFFDDPAINRRCQAVHIDRSLKKRRVEEVVENSPFSWVEERNREREEVDLHQIQVCASRQAGCAEEVQP